MTKKARTWITWTCLVFLYFSFSVLSKIASSGPFDPGGQDDYLEVDIVMQPDKCSEEDRGVLLVHSYVGNFELRSSQREAKKLLLKGKEFKHVFVLFQSSEVDMEEVKKEWEEHMDILVCNKEEGYRALAFKHLAALRWVNQNCDRVETVVKMDDDIFVDFARILPKVTQSVSSSPFYMAGMLQITLPILRDRQSKWAVTEEEMSGHHYPDFLSGWCYFTTPAAVRRLLERLETNQPPLFWIDDVWVTGFLAPKAGLRLVSLNLYFTVYSSKLSCCLRSANYSCPFLVGPTVGPWSVGPSVGPSVSLSVGPSVGPSVETSDSSPARIRDLAWHNHRCTESRMCSAAPEKELCQDDNFFAGQPQVDVIYV